MGCRLHHAATYKIEWKGGWFNWNAEQFRTILNELGIEVWDVVGEDDYAAFEMSIDEWEKLGKKFKEIPNSEWETPVLGEDYRNEDEDALIRWKDLNMWYEEVNSEYDHDNNYIRFEWF